MDGSPFTGWIGVARQDITPPTGIYARNWGAAAHDVATGIHRPLHATVLTIAAAEDEPPLVLAAIDLGWFKSPADERVIRQPLLDALNLDPARLMVCLSHTHAGPSICLDDAHQPGGDAIAPYLAIVAKALIEATREAIASAEPAILDWRYGRCGLARNRDLPVAGSPGELLVGFNPDASADDTLLVGRVTAANGALLATIVNYACHPTTLAYQNSLISPDFVGAMGEVIEAQAGGLSLFLQGASGELAPAQQYTGDTTVADKHGRQLGYAVLATLNDMPPPAHRLGFQGAVESGARLAQWQAEPVVTSRALAAYLVNVALPLKPLPTVDELDAQIASAADGFQRERLTRRRRLVQFVGSGPQFAAPLWGWRIGDAILLGQPNECYSAWQQALRATWPSQAIAVMNVVNGSCGYVVPRHLCVPGRYAYWQSLFAAGAYERLLAESTALVDALLQEDSAG